MSGKGATFRPSSSASIPATSILHVSVLHDMVKGVAVDCRFTIEDAKRRINKKLSMYNVDTSNWGFYEFHGTQAVREINDSEVLHNITKNWSSTSMYKFVFQPRPQNQKARSNTGYNFSESANSQASSNSASNAGGGGGGSGGDDYEIKLKEQKARMNRLSVRMTNRKSRGLTLTNNDKLREIKVEQMGKRLTLMHQELEAAKKLAQQADEYERRKKEEEELMRKKASELETKYQEMELTARASLQPGQKLSDARASITPEMQKQLDEMRDKRKQTEDRLAQIEAQMAAKRKQRREQAAVAQQKQVELMEAKLRQLEAELEREESKGDISEDEVAKQVREMEREQNEWESQRQAEMRKRQVEFEKERREREGRLKLQQDEMEAKIKMVEQALSEQARKREQNVIDLKQRKVVAMENRLKELEKQLAAGQVEAEEELKEAQEQLSVEQAKVAIAQKEKELADREAKLELLFSKVDKIEALESMVQRLQSMPMGGMGMGMGGGMSLKSGKELKEEIEELQKILMDPNKTEKEIEEANIKLEKALDAYEKTPECMAELQKKKEEWIKKNEPLNKAAFQKMSQVYNLNSLKNDPKTLDRVKKYPELRLLMMNQETILKKHENDFKTFVLNGLSEDELRAIRSVLPKFRADQRAQTTFVDSLDTKIEEASKAQPLPKPAVKKTGKKFVAKKATGGGGPPGNLFAEILAKKGGGNLKAAPPSEKSSGGGGGGGFPPVPGGFPPIPGGPGGFPPIPGGPGGFPPIPGGPGGFPPIPGGPGGSGGSASRGPPPSAAGEFGALKNSLDALLNAVMNGTEKDIAAQTRNTVADLKKLSATVKGYKPDDSQKLEQMASLIVVGVKEALQAKKTNDMEFVQAQSKLARINEKVKKQASDAVA